VWSKLQSRIHNFAVPFKPPIKCYNLISSCTYRKKLEFVYRSHMQCFSREKRMRSINLMHVTRLMLHMCARMCVCKMKDASVCLVLIHNAELIHDEKHIKLDKTAIHFETTLRLWNKVREREVKDHRSSTRRKVGSLVRARTRTQTHSRNVGWLQAVYFLIRPGPGTLIKPLKQAGKRKQRERCSLCLHLFSPFSATRTTRAQRTVHIRQTRGGGSWLFN